MYASSTMLGQILGITGRRVRQLVDEQVLTKDEKTGKYHIPACVQKFIEYKCMNATTENADYEKERALHEKAKREKTELQLAVMKGKLHKAEDVEIVMTDMITKAKTKLRGLSIKIAPSLLAQEDINIVEHIVSEAMDECLQELSDYNPILFTNPELIVLEGGEEQDESGESE